jgi:beta-lactamase regulating signal transducer with metallopeptidase domain
MLTTSPDLLTFLLNALWQAPLAAAVAALVSRVLRDGPASHRHAVWVAALVAAVWLPAASVRPHRESTAVHFDAAYLSASPMPAQPATNAAPAEPTQSSGSRVVPFPRTVATILWAAYLIFLAARLVRFAWACLHTVRLRRTATVPDPQPPLQHIWQRCRDIFGISNVELRFSPSVPSPVTTGAWRKTVILPQALLAETSADVLTTAIGHEMAHVARRDFALNLVYELLCLPISFHPAAWIIRRAIERTREMACDELVTRKLLAPDVYAEALTAIAAQMTELPRPACTLGVFSGDALEERVRRLLDRRAANLKRAGLLFATGLSVLGICAVLASGLALTARAQTESQVEMKQGVDAYNSGDFKSAADHFQNAVRTDPAAVKPKLFLANALMREYFAGQPPDSAFMIAARRQYLDAAALDPVSIPAIQGVVTVDINLKELDEAQQWAAKLIKADAGDKTAYYTAGVVDWAVVFPEFQRAKLAAGGKPQDYFISDPTVRQHVRDQYEARVDEGLLMLQTAMQIDPQYDDAMAYTNLLYRLKAGLADNPAESAAFIAKADEWVGRALATKRAHPHTGQAGPPQLDADGPAPGPASAQLTVAPPPPPPPPPPGGSLRSREIRP